MLLVNDTVYLTMAFCPSPFDGRGAVVKVEHSSFKLLTTTNEEVPIALNMMGRKKSSKGVVALDVQGKRLEVNSPVVCIDGPKKDKSGFVKHIFKSYVFVHFEKDKAHAGIYCARARQCRLADSASLKPSLQGFDVDLTSSGSSGAAGAQ